MAFHQPKVTLADCERIQAEFKIGTPAKALSARFGVSVTIIYKILDGKYSVQVAARKEAAKLKAVAEPDGAPLCTTCGLSTRVPCPVCTARETVDSLDVTPGQ